MLKITRIFFICVICIAFSRNAVMGYVASGYDDETCSHIPYNDCNNNYDIPCVYSNGTCHACHAGTYLAGIGTSLKVCLSCPSPYTQSEPYSVDRDTSCYVMVGSERYYYGQTLPCEYYDANENTCESQPECVWNGIDCTLCSEDKYPDKTEGTCRNCPTSYPKADEGATGIGSCYKECNASLSPNGNILSTASSTASYGNECNYTYECNVGYYQSGSASAPQCSSCSNKPNNNAISYTTDGPRNTNLCPWAITCPTGQVFNGTTSTCIGCGNYKYSSWGTSSQITVKNYATADSPESICATDSTHSACTTPPVCQGYVYHVTFDTNLASGETTSNTPTTELWQKYDSGWYTNSGATNPLTNNTLVTPSTPNLFMGYYTDKQTLTQRTTTPVTCPGTKVFNDNGSPVSNTLIITNDTKLYACYGAPIQYNITITNGSKTFTKNGCENVCDLDNLASTLTTNDGTYIKITTYDYGSIAWDGTKFTFQPNTNGINYINSSTNKLITLNNVIATCQTGYYCDESMRQQKCPFGTTSNATGTKIVTDCKYFKSEDDNKMYFRDRNSKNVCNDSNKTCFLLNVKNYAPVEISDKLKALLLNK